MPALPRVHRRRRLTPRVLLVQHTAEVSGSTISGQLIARGFADAGWEVETALGSPGAGESLYHEVCGPPHIVPHNNWLRGGDVARFTLRIARELANSAEFVPFLRFPRPDLVYVNTIVSVGAALAARRLGIPCIWHIRELFNDAGGEMKIPPIGGRSLVRRIIGSCADHVVVISQAVRENILGPAWKGHVSVVPNAVSERFFDLEATRDECRHALGLPVTGPLIGVPGTLRPMKGHDFFLRAAAEVARQTADINFAITGEGDAAYTAHLRERVAELGLEPRTRFLGTIVNMPEFYRACDIVCIPSRAEPFGRTVIEAFATGTPVVASAVGGIREIITDGRTGLLVDYDNDESLARALLRLVRDADLRRELAGAAREDAGQKYTAAGYHEQINGIVRETLSARYSRVRCKSRSPIVNWPAMTGLRQAVR